MSLLEVKNLRIEYPSRHGVHAAVKSLSFNIERGEIVGVVGESGAGKSTVGNAVSDLLSLLVVLPAVMCSLMVKKFQAFLQKQCAKCVALKLVLSSKIQ